jgi:hypothetical protein
MRVEGRCSINDPQFSKMLFIKNIKVISLRFNPSSAQAGKPVPPDSLGDINGISVERDFCKRLKRLLFVILSVAKNLFF